MSALLDWLCLAPYLLGFGYDEHVEGIALVQMLTDRTLRFEVFPRKKAVDVSGFSQAALIYER